MLYLNLGGGLGIRYGEEVPPTPEDYARTLISETERTGLQLVIEPGRTIVGNTGVLLTRVIATKKTDARAFVVVDAAMTELIRPSLYEAYHEISPVQAPPANEEQSEYDIVGPVCETTDIPRRALPPARGQGGRSSFRPKHRRLRGLDGVQLQYAAARN